MHTCRMHIYFLSFVFLLPLNQSPFFFFSNTHSHTHTPLWGDWCCKLAWVCRWSGCDYCLAPRQLWWWHSVLWAPLAWARSKHNQAVHSLYLATMHVCGLDTTATHTRRMRLKSGCAFRFWCGSVKFMDDKKRHVSCVLCAPGGQVMCILLCLKVRCDFWGSRHPLSPTHTQLLCCLQEVQPALESAGCSSSLFYLSVLSPPLSVSHLLCVSVYLI